MTDENIIPTTPIEESISPPPYDRKVNEYLNDTSYKLQPQCFHEKQMGLAITNRGELIPCCRCDDPRTIDDPEFQKLLAVSRIADYDTIEQILETEEWKQFEQNLRNHKGPYACWSTCRIGKKEEYVQVSKQYDPVTNTLVGEHRR